MYIPLGICYNKIMNKPIIIVGNDTHNTSKNVKYDRSCNNCGKRYIGWGKLFCSKKCRMQPKGENSPSWKGSSITRKSGWTRAQKMYATKPCEVCGKERVDRHHIDTNTKNNSPDNIKFLCRKHHKAIHGPYPSQNQQPSQ